MSQNELVKLENEINESKNACANLAKIGESALDIIGRPDPLLIIAINDAGGIVNYMRQKEESEYARIR